MKKLNNTNFDPRKFKEVIYQGKVYTYIERSRSHNGEYIYLLEIQPGVKQWVRALSSQECVQ